MDDVLIKGWVRTRRDSKEFSFLEINDGSCLANIQAVVDAQAEGFDLSKVREDTWEGRPAWVVGAAAGDLASHQFWIEKERLIFLRLVQKTPAGAISDIRFTKYEPLWRGWIGTVVVFNTDGKETFREVYRDWRVNPDVTDSLFDTSAWKPPSWVK